MTTGRLFLTLFLLTSMAFSAGYSEQEEFKTNKIYETSIIDGVPWLFGDGYINTLNSSDDASWGAFTGLKVKKPLEKISERSTIIVGDTHILVWEYEDAKGLLSFQLINRLDYSDLAHISYQYKGVVSNIDNIYGLKGTWGAGKFWVPTYQGGIAVVNPLTKGVESILPLDAALVDTATYVYKNDPEHLRPLTAVFKNDTLFVASEDSVIRCYDVNTGLWGTVSLPQENSKARTLAVDSKGELVVYSTLFDTAGVAISGVLERIGANSLTIHSGYVADFKFGESGKLYVQHSDSVSFSVYSSEYVKSDEGSLVSDAVNNNSDLNFAKVTDFSVSDNQFVIATTQGVVYFSEYDAGLGEYVTFRRDTDIKSGLKEVYAAPSIITDEGGAIIEYSLSEDDNVTIDIYDVNLDFVCRVIDNQPRKAGGDKHSTNRAVDRWDGSFDNNGGATVAPGVYYFKLVAEKGGRAFGKVIVAKN